MLFDMGIQIHAETVIKTLKENYDYIPEITEDYINELMYDFKTCIQEHKIDELVTIDLEEYITNKISYERVYVILSTIHRIYSNQESRKIAQYEMQTRHFKW